MSGVYIPSHIRAARRMTGFILFLIGVALTVGLYYVKTRAQTARKQAVKIERQIEQEEASLRVLQAEIAYLENPERLKALSEEQLGLQPVSVKNVINVQDIKSEFPLRDVPLTEGVAQ
jgi:cell division protein FtsL